MSFNLQFSSVNFANCRCKLKFNTWHKLILHSSPCIFGWKCHFATCSVLPSGYSISTMSNAPSLAWTKMRSNPTQINTSGTSRIFVQFWISSYKKVVHMNYFWIPIMWYLALINSNDELSTSKKYFLLTEIQGHFLFYPVSLSTLCSQQLKRVS